jgi:hypothetical protein
MRHPTKPPNPTDVDVDMQSHILNPHMLGVLGSLLECEDDMDITSWKIQEDEVRVDIFPASSQFQERPSFGMAASR